MTKVILITGTSSGIGVDIAVQLAKSGHRVFATMRNLEKQAVLRDAVEKANVCVEVKRLDVQENASITDCVAEIMAQEGRIDVLVNNAGAGYVRTTEQATEEEIKWVMDVNFMGVVRCTKAVLPHMRAARRGHIVNITSVGGLVGQPFNEFYCAAKFAVEGYTESLASYVQPTFNVKFSAIEPGGVHTEFVNNVLAQFERSGGIKEDAYRPLFEQYIGGAQARSQTSDGLFQTSDQVAEVVLRCIEDPEPPLRMRTSDWSNAFCQLKTQADPTGTQLRDHVTQTFL